MDKPKYLVVSSVVSIVAAIVGLVFWFVPALPTLGTVICAGFCVVDSLLQVFGGYQKTIATESMAVIGAALAAWRMHFSFLHLAAFALCAEGVLLGVVIPGIMFLVFLVKTK